jgi:NADP-dependent 3-hydroxy acid dehydrogenase YdfG
MILFITGATAGFGAAIARRFAQDGARIVATGRRAERLTALARELGPNLLPVALDVRDRAAVERAVAGLPDGFRDIDLLVNNAGLALGLDPAQKASLQDRQTMVDTNRRPAERHPRDPAGHGRATAAMSSTWARWRRHILIPAATSTAPPRPSSISSA